ncbi:MAG: DNA polymerase III subunit alpha [Phycisphaerae bacterium]|nr:DNA polymerase III subunit alpha [Phycisphaerae bacterium]
MDDFVHLHVHSHYSLLDGAASIGGLVKTAADLGMKSLALTDHGNLFGAVDFYNTAKRAGIKPILGLEAYISPTTRFDKSMNNQRTASYHMVLLAMNETGWVNLKRLSSRSYMEGFYYKPRIDRELLAELHEGIICTTACLGGEIPAALLGNNYDKALKIAGEYCDIFGKDRFFVEIQNAGMDEQTRTNPDLVKIANDLGVGIVGTNDVHFLRADDKPSHEVLTCISTGKILADGGAMHYPESLYLRPAAEMRDALSEFPGAADNTLKIAEMCNVELDFTKQYLPVFPVPKGQTDDDFLRTLAEQGLRERFDDADPPQEYVDRLNHELKVIADKRYSSYFLIVNDFVEYARKNDIPSAPRGSGVGTLLGYALRIAEVDPLKYGLLFERFTDPERDEAPDLDIDICQEGRAKVIQYVREKYGHVAQIITYGTLKAKAVIRDVGRVLDIPLPEVDKICKLVTSDSLEEAIKLEPELQKLIESDPQIKLMMEHGKKLEGLARHAGVHAAGVIVADCKLEDIVPLYKQSDSEDAITQWDGPTSEAAGLMKMDFLGLRTLTIIQRARVLVKQRIGKDVDPEKIPLDDPDVFELFRHGNTAGVFQFESEGMQGILRQMQPTEINDLIAANALYRPGPMDLIPAYCSRKNGKEQVPSLHPIVDDILAETYGIMAYQEQVMLVMNRLGKMTLNHALTLQKAISKKKLKVIDAARPDFIKGAVENGITEKVAEDLFELILKFAGYGFNKSHSTRYAIVAYQTAYFKTHYPREFLAATLTFECGDTDKVVQYMSEAGRMKIKILPPDINTCGDAFAVDGEAVRFGLSAVKGVGHSAVEAIVAAREEHGKFTDLYNFCELIDPRAVNKGAIEALIKCGAFDALGASRAAMVSAMEKAIALGKEAAVNRRSGQMSFFGGGGGFGSEEKVKPQFPNVKPWSESELLAAEKETLGFYVSSHPLVKYAREMASLSGPDGVFIGAFEQNPGRYLQGSRVRIGCMIVQIRPLFTRKDNRKMAMLTLEDITGKCEAVIFPRAYETYADQLAPEKMVFITGTVDRSRDRASIQIDEVVPIDQAVELYTGMLEISFPPASDDEFANALKDLLAQHRGACTVLLKVRAATHPDNIAIIRSGREFGIKPSRSLADDLEKLLGDQKLLTFKPKPVAAAPENPRARFARKKVGVGG